MSGFCFSHSCPPMSGFHPNEWIRHSIRKKCRKYFSYSKRFLVFLCCSDQRQEKTQLERFGRHGRNARYPRYYTKPHSIPCWRHQMFMTSFTGRNLTRRTCLRTGCPRIDTTLRRFRSFIAWAATCCGVYHLST